MKLKMKNRIVSMVTTVVISASFCVQRVLISTVTDDKCL